MSENFVGGEPPERRACSERRPLLGHIDFGLVGIGAWILLSGNLVKALERWYAAWEQGVPGPAVWADVTGAILKRIVRVGFWSFVLLLLPGAVALSQLIILVRQTRVIEDQLRLQADVERRRLLSTLYDLRVCPGEDCQPVASAAERGRALVDFVELERASGRVPNLANAQLDDIVLAEDTDLSGVNFYAAKFRRAILAKVDFTEATLVDGDLSWANLESAIFEGAVLSGAFLEGTCLVNSRMESAALEGVSLRGATMGRLLPSMTQKQLDQTCGDSSTVVTAGLVAPEHWPCKYSVEIQVGVRNETHLRFAVTERVAPIQIGGVGTERSEVESFLRQAERLPLLAPEDRSILEAERPTKIADCPRFSLMDAGRPVDVPRP